LDPQYTSDGQLYAPLRFKQIVEERYLISKYLHTSYTDLGEVTPTERRYLIEFLTRDKEAENKLYEEHQRELNSRK
jgi:hypothetical protein